MSIGMSKVPERFWSLSSKVDHDVEVVRADVADEWKRQRDRLVEVGKLFLTLVPEMDTVPSHLYAGLHGVIAECEESP